MDLFEILFIALVILFPILEQVFRKNRGADGEGEGPEVTGPEAVGPERAESDLREVSPASQERRPVKAADMVPDDLWAVLTGEQRPTQEAGWEEEEVHFGGSPWREDTTRGYDAEDAAAPVELPEAYSLERLDIEAVSLEEPLPSPEVRHRQFHELVDQPAVRRKRQRSAVNRALRSSGGARRAFVLSEVLGPPKGLEN